ncbi:MAG: class I SAM-dependent methyltransferase [Gaiellaceae bacterium]
MQIDDYRRASHEVWGAMAAGWERWRAEMEVASAPVRAWLVRELAPQPGDTVLELSAGAGDTGFEIAALLGDEGRLISTDFAAEMVAVAERRGGELGLTNVEYRVVDAEQIDLDDDSVDGVVCRYGYMLMADPAAAFAETRRVLRPSGRLALAVWAEPERNPWASLGARLLLERGHIPPPEPGAPGIFALASEELLRSLVEGAGFTSLRTEEVAVSFGFSSIDEYMRWARTTAGALAMVLRSLPEEEVAVLSGMLEEAFRPFASDAGYEFPGVALCTVAG